MDPPQHNTGHSKGGRERERERVKKGGSLGNGNECKNMMGVDAENEMGGCLNDDVDGASHKFLCHYSNVCMYVALLFCSSSLMLPSSFVCFLFSSLLSPIIIFIYTPLLLNYFLQI